MKRKKYSDRKSVRKKQKIMIAVLAIVIVCAVILGAMAIWNGIGKEKASKPLNTNTPKQETYAGTTTENNKGSIVIDGENYALNGTVEQFLKDWNIDWSRSDMKKEELFPYEKGISKKLELTSGKYPQGVAVIVMNEEKKDISYKKATVESIIVDVSQMTEKPEVDLGEKIKWFMTKEQMEKLLGKPAQESMDGDMTALTYRLKSLSASVNFYFHNQGGLYRLMIY